MLHLLRFGIRFDMNTLLSMKNSCSVFSYTVVRQIDHVPILNAYFCRGIIGTTNNSAYSDALSSRQKYSFREDHH
jgi:hypothetical protein